ncbi:MAG: F0F1 ATP synthase subunit delta [Helicobacter sp.]|nr:F0F1 ATP synthase subunit delta [Helicobacter sp.]
MLNICKKYSNALLKILDKKDLPKVIELLDSLDLMLKAPIKNNKLSSLELLHSPLISHQKKQELLNSILIFDKSNLSKIVKNIALILFENKRLDLISYISNDLKKRIARDSNVFDALIYSRSPLKKPEINSLKNKLETRLAVTINMIAKTHDRDKILLEIPDLELSISFCQDKFTSELKHHILKAI